MTDYVGQGQRLCGACGRRFKPKKINQLYCAPHCRYSFSNIQKAARSINEHLVTVKEAADIAQCSEATIRRHMKSGALSSTIVPVIHRAMLKRLEVQNWAAQRPSLYPLPGN